MSELTYRYAQRADVSTILHYVKQLAEYENLSDAVVADEKTLEEWLFDKERAKVLLPLIDGQAIGFCLFFYNFSTFLGRSGLYIEDLYIDEQYRGLGYGKQILHKIFAIAKEEKLGRVEWCCLTDNTPSMKFYASQGAEVLEDWSMLRVETKNISE